MVWDLHMYVLRCGMFVKLLAAAANLNEQMHTHTQTQPAATLLL